MEKILFLIIISFVFISCETDKKNTNKNYSNEFISVSNDKIIQKEIKHYAKDTVLSSGWNIHYFLKNNERKEKDLYIKISNEHFVNTFLAENVLEYRRYFTPTFLTETNDNVIFKYGCATDCGAILLMSKNELKNKEYLHIVEFNKKRKILTYITDNTYKNEDNLFEIGIVNFKNKIEKTLKLNKMTSAVYKPSAIDTIIYKENEIIIVTNLRENITVNEPTKKKSVIKI